jgi:hypothetical protein
MNQQNLDHLKDDLKYLGFGDKLYADLEHHIRQGFPEFVLKMQSEFGNRSLDSSLHFRRTDASDLYYFNRHDAVLKNEVGTFEQTFYNNQGKGVTLKESFNLLEGRAVYKEITPKEGPKYHAWIQLDLKTKEENGNYKVRQYHENYGYDLAYALGNYSIKEMQNDQQRQRLTASLQRGNLQSVTIASNGKEQMFYIEANPQYKSINIYNPQLQLLSREQRESLMEPTAARKKLNGQEIKPSENGLARGENKESVTEKTINYESVKNLLPQKEGEAQRRTQRV